MKVCTGVFFISALAFLAPTALADGLSDANAALEALNGGDFAKAVTLLTRAIDKGKLGHDDLELAYVKRAQAYIDEKQNDLGLADLTRAETLSPNDKDIASLRAQAQGAQTPASSANNDYFGGFEGRWEGTLKTIAPDGYDTAHGSGPKTGYLPPIALVVNGESVAAYTKHADGSWVEVKPGYFHILTAKSNAEVTAINSSDQGGWVETWNFSLTHLDRDNLLVSFARVVNNYNQPGATTAGRFFVLAFGNMQRISGQ